MKQYIDYIKTFSTKKKVLCSLSFIAFLYELFTAVALIIRFCGFEDIFSESIVYSFLETPIIACAYFPPISVYIILFPVIYAIINIVFLHKMEFDISIVLYDFAVQIIHPATLVWAGYVLVLIFNALGVINLG